MQGLCYDEHILSEEEGNALIQLLDDQTWTPLSSSPNSRRVQQYGFIYDYNASTIHTKGPDLLDGLRSLRDTITRMVRPTGWIPEDDNTEYFNQCICNEYKPSQGISKHIDNPSYGDVIACVTLGSGTTITFRPRSKGNGTLDQQDVYVAPNSVYFMAGDARYKWTHEITPRSSDTIHGTVVPRSRRISVTFRHVPPRK